VLQTREGFFEVGMAIVSTCHRGTATSDVGAGVAGFGPLVHGGSRSGTQIVAFLVRGPRQECPKSLRTQRALYSKFYLHPNHVEAMIVLRYVVLKRIFSEFN